MREAPEAETVAPETSEASSTPDGVAPTTERVPATVLARRLDWAALLLRVFAIDVLECPRCSGRMKILAFITRPDVVRRILEHLDLPTTSPDTARGPPPSWRVAS